MPGDCIRGSTNAHLERRNNSRLTYQFLQQGLGVLQIRRIEPFRQPLVPWGEQVVGLLVFAMRIRSVSPGLCVIPSCQSATAQGLSGKWHHPAQGG